MLYGSQYQMPFKWDLMYSRRIYTGLKELRLERCKVAFFVCVCLFNLFFNLSSSQVQNETAHQKPLMYTVCCCWKGHSMTLICWYTCIEYKLVCFERDFPIWSLKNLDIYVIHYKWIVNLSKVALYFPLSKFSIASIIERLSKEFIPCSTSQSTFTMFSDPCIVFDEYLYPAHIK